MNGRRQTRRTVLSGVAGVVATGVVANGASASRTPIVGEEWPQYGYDAANTGHAPDGTVADRGVTEAWSFQVEEGTLVSPVVAAGTVYVATRSGTLYAVGTASGTEQWSVEYTGDNGWTSPPALTNGTVYVGTINDDLYALDAASGDVQWRDETDDSLNWVLSPTVRDGTVYAGSSDARASAVDAETGAVQWEDELPDPATTPAVADGTVYYGSINNEGGRVTALSAASGTRSWTNPLSESANLIAAPVVGDGQVYVASDDSNLYALDADEGDVQWSYDAGEDSKRAYVPPTVADGTVYVTHDQAAVSAVDASSGDNEWTAELAAWSHSKPVVVGDTLLIGTDGGTLAALDAASGDQRWTHEFDSDDPVTTAAVANETIYVSVGDTMYALVAASPPTDTESTATSVAGKRTTAGSYNGGEQPTQQSVSTSATPTTNPPDEDERSPDGETPSDVASDTTSADGAGFTAPVALLGSGVSVAVSRWVRDSTGTSDQSD